MVLKCFLFALLFGFTWAQSELSLPENFTLPPELEGKIDEEQLKGLQNQTLPVVKKKCEENGGPDAYDNAQKAFENFSTCLKSLVDPEKLQHEIEEASPNGQVDEVFKGYCAKTPQFKTCFKNMTSAVRPCFTDKERENLKTVYNVTEQLAEFICYKEGDRIALFIAEGGRECFQEKQDQLQDCANKTLGSDFQMDPKSLSADNIPNIAFGEKECRQLTELQICVVGVLETCEAPTTGNIVESMFKFIRKATPCADIVETKRQSKPGSATGLAVTSATVLLGLATALFV
ncbi:hypothetical protein ABMA27_015179 [Loxostege sticticalis]|uniref:27 kDa hemolymph protein n=1 Tax=Loxostege sticticalis TaxID=481309 RepID=A0ABR3I6Q6_LOXSC